MVHMGGGEVKITPFTVTLSQRGGGGGQRLNIEGGVTTSKYTVHVWYM